MNCTMCGAIIPTGEANCPMCGAPIPADQPTPPQSVSPQSGQPMNAQPVSPQPGQPVNPQMGQPVNPQMGQPVNPQMGQPVNPQMGQPMNAQPGQPMNAQPGYGQPMGAQPYGQPMNAQPGYGQPMGAQPYGQPMGAQPGYYQPKSNAMGFNVNGYVAYLKSNVMNIVKIAAGVLLFLAVFLPWGKVGAFGYSETYNLFKAGGMHVFFALMLLVISLALIAWEIGDFVPPIANIKAKAQRIPYIELILVGAAFLFVLLPTILIPIVHDSGETMNFSKYGLSVTRVVGCIFGWIAVVAAAVPRILDIAGVKIGRK